MNRIRHCSVLIVIFFGTLCLAACGQLDKGAPEDATPSPVSGSEAAVTSPMEKAEADAGTPEKTPHPPRDVSACIGLDTGEKTVLKSQTFPIDFEPFRRSCFVTTHDPESTDPPLGSKIGVFKDGTQIYQFESTFDGNSATCWVIAVGFRDINDDGLTDVVIAGKCGAKSGPVVTNEIQMNDGRGFYTNVAGNDELGKFMTIKEITDFARKNKQLFER